MGIWRWLRTLWRGRSAPSEFSLDVGGESLAELVLLLRDWAPLEQAELDAALIAAFGPATDADAHFASPVVEQANYLVKARGEMLTVLQLPNPYFPDPALVAASIQGDDELAANVRSHRAFLSLTCLRDDDGQSAPFDVLGPLAAALARAENAVALAVPLHNTLIAFDETRREQLRGPSVLQRLGFED